MILINGFKLNDFVDGVDESKFFHSTSPKRVYEEVTIPGRDGVLHLDQKRFAPYTLSIPVFFRSDFENRYRQLLNILNGMTGVIPVICTPAPIQWGEGHYDAIFYGAIPAPDTGSFMQSGKVTIEFQCNPRWWLDTGSVVSNPTLYTSYSSETGYRNTANFTYHTGDTFLLGCTIGSGVSTGNGVITFRPNTKSPIYLSLNSDAQTAWAAGLFYDIGQLLEDGDIVCLQLSTSSKWRIMSDIPTGTTETYAVGDSSTVFNSTPFKAQPLLEVTAVNDSESTGATYLMQVSLNDIIVRVLRSYATDHSGLPLYIDCETQDCYYISSGVRYNANAYVVMYKNSLSAVTTDFPVLKPGNNIFNESSGSTLYYYPLSTFRYYPRWYLI